ncbi:MAG TPA: hypothetical protein VNT79_13380 [Phycisphaerae bacterium]|nr:hypothetical protein [Phycisphaerae bacterium]
MKNARRFGLRRLRVQKWMGFAAMSAGTAFQVSACREEAALFGLRTAFTAITLPINTFIRDLLLGLV